MLGPRIMGASSNPGPYTQPLHRSSVHYSASTSLQRQKSTKQLISRYESMSLSPGKEPTPRRPMHRHEKGGSLETPKKMAANQAGQKDKSPIRQSFRNLLSVIKKTTTGLSKRRSDDRLHLLKSGQTYDGPPGVPAKDIPRVDELEPLQNPRDKKISGPLLYLSHSHIWSDSSGLAWVSCTANIQGNKILVSWFTPLGDPCIHEIMLSRCSDIRSLSLRYLEPEEASLLPSTGDEELKVFEILFEGRAREKFASTSVKDRANWISAIWDAILPSQDLKNVPTESRPSKLLTAPHIQVSEQVESPIPTPLPIPSPLLSPTYSEGSAPPVPLKPSLPALMIPGKLGDPFAKLPSPSGFTPISPSVYSPVSRPVSSASYRSTSPSVANLGQLAVVKQRLAQIERNQPQSPQHGIHGSAVSQGSQLQGYKALPPRGDIQPSFQWPASETSFQRNLSGAADFDSRENSINYHKVAKDLTDIKSILGGETSYPTVQQLVVGLDHRIQGTGESLNYIQDILQGLAERSPVRPEEESTQISAQLRAISTQLTADIPVVLAKLTDLQETERANQRDALKPVGTIDADYASLHMKLEELVRLCSTKMESNRPLEDNNGLAQELAKILSLIEEDNQNRSQQTQQQADSVRYLNELNTWLESFVNNGTSQIQGLATNVEQLCMDLGCTAQPPGALQPPDAPNLLNDIRQLACGMQMRDQNLAELHASVNGLLEVISAETRQGSGTQAIAGMLERQRLDHEHLLRTFTNEISSEIKGERLRFVEAMKEATAINIQTHIEQFKKELNKEVMGMTEEVHRLHRDKRTIENQIADLFAFYSKQKQATNPLAAADINQPVSQQMFQNYRSTVRTPRQRPLPHPRRT